METKPVLLDKSFELAIRLDDLEPIEIPFTYKGIEYVMVEASADAGVKYRNCAMRAAKMTDGKVVGLDGAANVEPLLVSLCAFRVDGEKRSPLTEEYVRKNFSNKLLKRLFDKVREISGELEEKETVTSLQKKIEALQVRLKEIQEKEAQNLPNLSSATTEPSV